MAFINDYLTEEEKKKFEEYNLLYPTISDHRGLRLGVEKERKNAHLIENVRYIYFTQ